MPRFGGIEVSMLGWILRVLAERDLETESGSEDRQYSGFSVL